MVVDAGHRGKNNWLMRQNSLIKLIGEAKISVRPRLTTREPSNTEELCNESGRRCPCFVTSCVVGRYLDFLNDVFSQLQCKA